MYHRTGFVLADLPGPSGSDLPLVKPQGTVSGSNDAAGNPFWFNGKVPNIGFNPALLGPSHATTYDGTSRVDSGLPLGPPSPVKIRFTRAGTFKYFCDVHHGMVGYVVVKPKHKPVPTAKQDRAALIAQVTAAVKSAKQIAGRKVATDTVSLGLAGSGGVELFQMFPSTLTVSPGTTVTFTMSRSSRERHTATFGPIPYLKSLVKAFRGKTFSPIDANPSDPVQPITLGPSSHGNGFANLGVLSLDPTTHLSSSGQIKFTTAGTYHFVCVIHPFMRGTIIVK